MSSGLFLAALPAPLLGISGATSPQQYAAPVVPRAQVLNSPAARLVNATVLATADGSIRGADVPFPNCPLAPSPQQYALPSDVRRQLWRPPATIVAACCGPTVGASSGAVGDPSDRPAQAAAKPRKPMSTRRFAAGKAEFRALLSEVGTTSSHVNGTGVD